MTVRLAAGLLLVCACFALPRAAAQPPEAGKEGRYLPGYLPGARLMQMLRDGEAQIIREESIDVPFGEANWDTRPLNEDPVSLKKVGAVRASVAYVDRDGKTLRVQPLTLVRFVLELQRDLTVRDPDWTGIRPRPPFLVRFQDADGVALLVPAESERPGYDCTFVGQAKARLRMVVLIPDPPVAARTKKVMIDHTMHNDLNFPDYLPETRTK
jgi:hypothetical protein